MARRFSASSDHIRYGHLSVLDDCRKCAVSWMHYPESQSSSNRVQWAQYTADGLSGIRAQTVSDDETALRVMVEILGGDREGSTATGALTLDTWQHCFVVFDGAGATNADRLRIWINGTQQSLTFGADIPTRIGATGGATFELGQTSETSTPAWFGRLAELAIWVDFDKNIGVQHAINNLSKLADRQTPKWFQPYIYLPLRTGDGALDVFSRAGTPTITGTTEVDHPTPTHDPGHNKLNL